MSLVLRSSKNRLHSAFPRGLDVLLPAIGAVSHELVWTRTRTPARPLDGRDRIQQFNSGNPIVEIGGGGCQRHRRAGGVDYDMAFAAVFPAICRVGAGVCPPKTARTVALSITARFRSTPPFRPRRLRTSCHSRGHNPASVHSLKRRQQVGPLAAPSSGGIWFQAQPVLRTKTMPMRQLRSGTRGRPPLGLGGCAGRSFRVMSHRSSVTHSWAMVCSPPWPLSACSDKDFRPF